jgi:hypothetical protein
MVAGFPFGLIIGYISWYVFRPGESKDPIPVARLATFVAVIGGAGILSLFPSGTQLFESYAVGLATGFFGPLALKLLERIFDAIGLLIGFFGPPIWKLAGRAVADLLADDAPWEQDKKISPEERAAVNADWSQVETIIDEKLRAALGKGLDNIEPSDLRELQYSESGVLYSMKRYARVHIADGIEFVVVRPSNFVLGRVGILRIGSRSDFTNYVIRKGIIR